MVYSIFQKFPISLESICGETEHASDVEITWVAIRRDVCRLEEIDFFAFWKSARTDLVSARSSPEIAGPYPGAGDCPRTKNLILSTYCDGAILA